MASKDEVLEAMVLAHARCQAERADFPLPERYSDLEDTGARMIAENVAAALRAADALGWKLVPKEATAEMISAGHVSDPLGCDLEDEDAPAVYKQGVGGDGVRSAVAA